MAELLHAGVRRYLRSVIFWLGILATAVIALICAYNTYMWYLDDFYIMIEFIVFAVVISWLIGREHAEGSFRNKIIAGHTKGAVFLSELVLAEGAAIAMFLVYAGIFTAFNSYTFGVLPTSILALMFVDVLLVNMFFAAMVTVVVCLINNRFIALVVSVILVVAVAFFSQQLINLLNQPEYNVEYDYEKVEITDDDGNVYISFDVIPDSMRLVKNPYYIDGAPRRVLIAVEHLSPYCHIGEYNSMTYSWFGYGGFSEYSDEWRYYLSSDMPTEDDIRNTAINIIYTITVLAAVGAFGYFCFRKKELK